MTRSDPDSRDARLSVCIVTHRSRREIEACLRSIDRQTVPPREVVVVDNASDDGTLELLDGRRDVEVVALPRNVGFATANNLAVRLTTAPLVGLVNPDVELEPDWIAEMTSAAERHPSATSLASVQILPGDPPRFDGVGDAYHASGVAWRRGHRARVRPVDRDVEVFSACGAAAVHRREAFESVGGFEESFFCYYEDLDLGFRQRLAGGRCILVASARCRHAGGASSGGARSDLATRLGHRNMVWCYARNMPGLLAVPLLVPFLAGQLTCLLHGLATGRGRAMISAKLEALRGLPAVMRSRRAIQRGREASILEIARALEWSPWPDRGRLP